MMTSRELNEPRLALLLVLLDRQDLFHQIDGCLEVLEEADRQQKLNMFLDDHELRNPRDASDTDRYKRLTHRTR